MRRLVLVLATAFSFLTLPLSPVSASTPPAAPVLTQSAATSTTASFTWSTPASASPVTRYELRRNGTLIAANLAASLTAYTFNSLTPASTSTVLLRACSALGCSPDSTPLLLGTAPASPSSLAATAAPGSVQLTWASSAETHVWFKTSAALTWTEWTPGVSDTSPTTVSGLPNGVAHVFRVEARNGYGSSWSPFSSSTVSRDVPGRPVLTFSRATASSVTVSWVPPATNGASITGYKFYKDGVLVASTGSVGSYTFSTLTSGGSYALTAEACNSLGCSAASDVLTSMPLPSGALSPTVAPLDGSVRLNWSAIAGASAYRVAYRTSTSTTWVEWTPGLPDVAPTTITGLVNGTAYVFAVAALNPSGASALATVSGTPRGAPGSPALSLVSSTATSASLAWTPPSSNGSNITSFKLLRNGVQVVSTTGLTFTASGLTAGSSPKFVVQACNAAGCTASNELTVALLPTIPPLSVSRADGTVSLSWTLPTGSLAVPSLWYKLATASTWVEWTPGVPDTSPATVSGLVNGAAHHVKLRLSTDAGSVESATLTAVPAGVPHTAPAPLTSPYASVSSVGLTWGTPTDTGGLPITGFRLWRNGNLIASPLASARNFAVSSLPAGTFSSYQLQVCNIAGCSPISTATLAATLALPPTNLAVVAQNGDLVVSWSASLGDAVSEHVVWYTESTATPWIRFEASSPVSPATVSGLTGQRYSFRVCAVDPAGNRCTGITTVTRPDVDYTPPPPRFPLATPVDMGVLLSWSAPSSNPGSAIVDYVVEYRAGTQGSWTPFADGTSTATSATVTGLTNGVAYQLRVSAVNAMGVGAPSATASASPRTTPTQLAAPTATAVGSKSVTLTWSAPSSDGGAAVSGYAIYRDGSLVATVPASPRIYDDTPLATGTLYAYQVLALNVAGSSPFSAALVLPTLPDTLLAPTLSTQPGSIEVVFDDTTIEVVDFFAVFYRSVPSSGSNPWIEWTPGVDDASPTTLTGLLNGTTYEVRVDAANASGVSEGASALATPVAPPSAPRTLAAYSGTESVSLSWLAPLDDGGTSVVDYEVEFSSNAGSSWSTFADGTSTATSATVSGLVAGSPYLFWVRACNAAGCGVKSTVVSASAARITPPTRTTSWELTSATLYKRNNWLWIKADTDVANVDTAIAGLNSIDEMNEPTGDSQAVWQLSVDGRPFECVQLGYNQSCDAQSNQVYTGASFPSGNVGLFPASLMVWEYAGYNGMINGVCYTEAGGSPSNFFTLQLKTPSGEFSNRIDVSCAIKTAFAPSAVEKPSVAAAAGEVALTWSIPSSDGGASISDYVVEYKTSSASSWSTFADGTSTATSTTVTGLVNGTEYLFRVAAVNAAGTGAMSVSVEATPEAPVLVSYESGAFSWQQTGEEPKKLYPTVSGGNASSFGYSGTLPPGVSFNTATGEFTGQLTFAHSYVSQGDHHGCALTATGGVVCWGYNERGQVGDGTTTNRLTPVQVTGLNSGVTQLVAGDYHTCAITSAGKAMCWGSNYSGELGDGTTTNRLTPVQVTGLTGVAQLSAGQGFTCALLDTGAVKCWGKGADGRLGDGLNTNSNVPVQVSGLTSGITYLASGRDATCAVTSAGAVQCWGYAAGTPAGVWHPSTPTAPANGHASLSSGISKVTLGIQFGCALTTDGGVRCWGGNSFGTLGDGTNTNSWAATVTPTGLSSGVASIDAGNGNHVCAVLTTGEMKCWGSNYQGQLGDGTTANKSTPVDVVTMGSGVLQVSTSNYHTCVRLVDAIKCWGSGTFGALGDGTTTNKTTPTATVTGSTGVPTGFPATVTVTATMSDGRTATTTVTLTE